jgi:hypothetical protein
MKNAFCPPLPFPIEEQWQEKREKHQIFQPENTWNADEIHADEAKPINDDYQSCNEC